MTRNQSFGTPNKSAAKLKPQTSPNSKSIGVFNQQRSLMRSTTTVFGDKPSAMKGSQSFKTPTKIDGNHLQES